MARWKRLVETMRTVFFGTPALAIPALNALADTTTVAGVVCQPDRRSGRGMRLQPQPVKTRALELGLTVHQPKKVRTGTLDAWLAERDVDVAVVLAYGRILPQAVLDAPRAGCVNLHASILPKYRGAAPINWAIIEGETETGISLMQMDAGLDTGDVLTLRRTPIGPTTTAGELASTLSELCATVIREDLPKAMAGDLPRRKQDHDAATHAPPLLPEHLILDWRQSPQRLVDRVRGLAPRPGARTELRGKSFKVHRLEVAAPTDGAGEPGTVVIADKGALIIRCGGTNGSAVRLLEAQLAGKRRASAADLVNGRTLKVGDRLGEAGE